MKLSELCKKISINFKINVKLPFVYPKRQIKKIKNALEYSRIEFNFQIMSNKCMKCINKIYDVIINLFLISLLKII